MSTCTEVQFVIQRGFEGNGTPLQYPCLENPMDGGAGRLQSMGSQRVGHDFTFTLIFTLRQGGRVAGEKSFH